MCSYCPKFLPFLRLNSFSLKSNLPFHPYLEYWKFQCKGVFILILFTKRGVNVQVRGWHQMSFCCVQQNPHAALIVKEKEKPLVDAMVGSVNAWAILLVTLSFLLILNMNLEWPNSFIQNTKLWIWTELFSSLIWFELIFSDVNKDLKNTFYPLYCTVYDNQYGPPTEEVLRK